MRRGSERIVDFKVRQPGEASSKFDAPSLRNVAQVERGEVRLCEMTFEAPIRISSTNTTKLK